MLRRPISTTTLTFSQECRALSGRLLLDPREECRSLSMELTALAISFDQWATEPPLDQDRYNCYARALELVRQANELLTSKP